MSKKDFVAKALSNTGILALMEILPKKPGLIIIEYHRVGSADRNLFDNRMFSVTIEQFDEQVAYLKQYFIWLM